jgi:hypothetical protein
MMRAAEPPMQSLDHGCPNSEGTTDSI